MFNNLGAFNKSLKCFSVIMMGGKERHDVDKGGKSWNIDLKNYIYVYILKINFLSSSNITRLGTGSPHSLAH